MLTQHDIVLAAGLRLPQARAGGAFKREDAAHMGAVLTRELLARTGLAPDAFDEVLAGCVGQPHDQANLARVIALRAGLPEATPAYTVARNCASGMEAVTSAVTQIMAGRGSSFLCLGVETMSAYPLLFNQKATDFFGRLAFSRSLGAKLGAIASWRPSMLAPRIALL
ncbi:MAG: acetyl-CoA acetyltransferase, partial [Planctomycetota bacterium]